MKIIPFSILLLTLLNFLVLGCAKPNYDEARNPASENEFVLGAAKMNVQIYWDHRPASTSDAGSMTLEFFDPQDRSNLMDPAEVKVKLWMPDMGHGSSPTKVTRLSRGVYRVNDMYFTMAGLWEVRVGVLNENGVADNFTKTERF